jgi:hypothetical protein
MNGRSPNSQSGCCPVEADGSVYEVPGQAGRRTSPKQRPTGLAGFSGALFFTVASGVTRAEPDGSSRPTQPGPICDIPSSRAHAPFCGGKAAAGHHSSANLLLPIRLHVWRRQGRSCVEQTKHDLLYHNGWRAFLRCAESDAFAPRYFSGTIAVTSTSTIMPGQASWTILSSVCAGGGVAPNTSARHLP